MKLHPGLNAGSLLLTPGDLPTGSYTLRVTFTDQEGMAVSASDEEIFILNRKEMEATRQRLADFPNVTIRQMDIEAGRFESGYDIGTAAGWDALLEEMKEKTILPLVRMWHLNGSKTAMGSRVDRHEHIGKGKIGKAAFRHIVNDPRFKNHPGCLETPKSEDLHEDVQNLAILRSLVRAGRSKARK